MKRTLSQRRYLHVSSLIAGSSLVIQVYYSTLSCLQAIFCKDFHTFFMKVAGEVDGIGGVSTAISNTNS